jgi:hypothetical protein
MTGDGNAKMQFIQKDSFASIFVDATADKYNVYWALIKLDVTKYLDLSLLKDTSFQLRVEARVLTHPFMHRKVEKARCCILMQNEIHNKLWFAKWK